MTYPLTTERLGIEQLSLADVDAFVRYRQDPQIARFQSWDTSYSLRQAIELIESQAGVMLPGEGEWLQLAVHSLATGELIGDLALHSMSADNSTFELGFTVAREHQGKGFAREAVSCLSGYLFSAVGATRVMAYTDRRNIASIRLLVSLGFEQRPEKSWDEVFKGETVTVNVYELLRD